MEKIMSSTPQKENQVRKMTRTRGNHVVASNRTDATSNMSSVRTVLLLPKCHISLLPLLALNIVPYIFTLLLLLLLLLSLDPW